MDSPNKVDRPDKGNRGRSKGRAGKPVRPIKKLHGLQHFLAAAGYSLGGARRLIGEAAFRQELLAFGVCMAAFVISGATVFQYVAMAILFLLMIAFEALNTAIEEIVDRVSPEISDMGRNAKDLGSLACLCIIVANGAYAVYVVFLSRFFAL